MQYLPSQASQNNSVVIGQVEVTEDELLSTQKQTAKEVDWGRSCGAYSRAKRAFQHQVKTEIRQAWSLGILE